MKKGPRGQRSKDAALFIIAHFGPCSSSSTFSLSRSRSFARSHSLCCCVLHTLRVFLECLRANSFFFFTTLAEFPLWWKSGSRLSSVLDRRSKPKPNHAGFWISQEVPHGLGEEALAHWEPRGVHGVESAGSVRLSSRPAALQFHWDLVVVGKEAKRALAEKVN